MRRHNGTRNNGELVHNNIGVTNCFRRVQRDNHGHRHDEIRRRSRFITMYQWHGARHEERGGTAVRFGDQRTVNSNNFGFPVQGQASYPDGGLNDMDTNIGHRHRRNAIRTATRRDIGRFNSLGGLGHMRTKVRRRRLGVRQHATGGVNGWPS